MEGKLAHHRVSHINKAVGSLFQQQSTAQIRVLDKKIKIKVKAESIHHNLLDNSTCQNVLTVNESNYIKMLNK